MSACTLFGPGDAPPTQMGEPLHSVLHLVVERLQSSSDTAPHHAYVINERRNGDFVPLRDVLSITLELEHIGRSPYRDLLLASVATRICATAIVIALPQNGWGFSDARGNAPSMRVIQHDRRGSYQCHLAVRRTDGGLIRLCCVSEALLPASQAQSGELLGGSYNGLLVDHHLIANKLGPDEVGAISCTSLIMAESTFNQRVLAANQLTRGILPPSNQKPC